MANKTTLFSSDPPPFSWRKEISVYHPYEGLFPFIFFMKADNIAIPVVIAWSPVWYVDQHYTFVFVAVREAGLPGAGICFVCSRDPDRP